MNFYITYNDKNEIFFWLLKNEPLPKTLFKTTQKTVFVNQKKTLMKENVVITQSELASHFRYLIHLFIDDPNKYHDHIKIAINNLTTILKHSHLLNSPSGFILDLFTHRKSEEKSKFDKNYPINFSSEELLLNPLLKLFFNAYIHNTNFDLEERLKILNKITNLLQKIFHNHEFYLLQLELLYHLTKSILTLKDKPLISFLNKMLSKTHYTDAIVDKLLHQFFDISNKKEAKFRLTTTFLSYIGSIFDKIEISEKELIMFITNSKLFDELLKPISNLQTMIHPKFLKLINKPEHIIPFLTKFLKIAPLHGLTYILTQLRHLANTSKFHKLEEIYKNLANNKTIITLLFKAYKSSTKNQTDRFYSELTKLHTNKHFISFFNFQQTLLYKMLMFSNDPKFKEFSFLISPIIPETLTCINASIYTKENALKVYENITLIYNTLSENETLTFMQPIILFLKQKILVVIDAIINHKLEKLYHLPYKTLLLSIEKLNSLIKENFIANEINESLIIYPAPQIENKQFLHKHLTPEYGLLTNDVLKKYNKTTFDFDRSVDGNKSCITKIMIENDMPISNYTHFLTEYVKQQSIYYTLLDSIIYHKNLTRSKNILPFLDLIIKVKEKEGEEINLILNELIKRYLNAKTMREESSNLPTFIKFIKKVIDYFSIQINHEDLVDKLAEVFCTKGYVTDVPYRILLSFFKECKHQKIKINLLAKKKYLFKKLEQHAKKINKIHSYKYFETEIFSDEVSLAFMLEE